MFSESISGSCSRSNTRFAQDIIMRQITLEWVIFMSRSFSPQQMPPSHIQIIEKFHIFRCQFKIPNLVIGFNPFKKNVKNLSFQSKKKIMKTLFYLDGVMDLQTRQPFICKCHLMTILAEVFPYFSANLRMTG